MSLASALNILRPTLPYYLALAKYDLLHLVANTVEFQPRPMPWRCLSARPVCPSLHAPGNGEPLIIAGKPLADALGA